MVRGVYMSESKVTENQTQKLFTQRLLDGCITILISGFILATYQYDWTSVHTSKANLIAIYFDMFDIFFSMAFAVFMFILPHFIEFLNGKRILYKYTSEKQLPTKLKRLLKITLVTSFIILCAITFTDKYSRVEFYNDGSIVEYNRNNEIINKISKNDIDYVELKVSHTFGGRHISYWTEAVIYTDNNEFPLTYSNYITPYTYDETNSDTFAELYGLRKVKEVFADKIRINTENIDTLLEVEHWNYTQKQGRELCDIFEVDYDEIALWLDEEWDIVLEDR